MKELIIAFTILKLVCCSMVHNTTRNINKSMPMLPDSSRISLIEFPYDSKFRSKYDKWKIRRVYKISNYILYVCQKSDCSNTGYETNPCLMAKASAQDQVSFFFNQYKINQMGTLKCSSFNFNRKIHCCLGCIKQMLLLAKYPGNISINKCKIIRTLSLIMFFENYRARPTCPVNYNDLLVKEICKFFKRSQDEYIDFGFIATRLILYDFGPLVMKIFNSCFKPGLIYYTLKTKYEFKTKKDLSLKDPDLITAQKNYSIESSKEMFESILFDIAKCLKFNISKNWQHYFNSKLFCTKETIWKDFKSSGYSIFLFMIMQLWGIPMPRIMHLDDMSSGCAIQCSDWSEKDISIQLLNFFKEKAKDEKFKRKNIKKGAEIEINFFNLYQFENEPPNWDIFRQQNSMPDKETISRNISGFFNSKKLNKTDIEESHREINN